MSTNEPNKTKDSWEEDKKYILKVGKRTFITSFVFLLVILGPLLAKRGGGGYSASPHVQASSILHGLQSAAAIYVAQQRKPPEMFSDFVTPSGKATGAKTMTLENVTERLIEPPILNKRKMILKFKPDAKFKAIYYLKGTDVTVKYIDLND